MAENKVYCSDCKFVVVNRSELFGEIVEKHCSKALEYEDTPFERKPIRESMEQMNGRNQCEHYVHILDVFGKPLAEKTKNKEEAKFKAEARRAHIKRYTLKEDWQELIQTGR